MCIYQHLITNDSDEMDFVIHFTMSPTLLKDVKKHKINLYLIIPLHHADVLTI